VGVFLHPLSLVDPSASLGEGVRVGPFAVIEAGVFVGDGSQIEAHAVLRAGTRMGFRNRVSPFAVLGGAPQDRRYAGEATRLEIGDDNVFREHVTAHRGTLQGGGVTRIGSSGLFMAGCHFAHDVIVGDHVTLANNTLLAGHVEVFEYAVTGGQVAVQPFVRIGARSFLAGGAMVERDVPPFVIAAGDRARVRALNHIGLQRSHVPESSRIALDEAFRELFLRRLPRAEALSLLASDPDPYVQQLVDFLRLPPKRPR